MDFYELRQVLMGNVRVVEYYNGLSDMRTIYEGEVDDISDEFDDLIVCSVESSNLNKVIIYVEAIDDGDNMKDFLDGDDFKDLESLEEQFDVLINIDIKEEE